ncbi:MAG: NAD(+)/NADH kinase [Candidatus Hodarchaeales archaeon]
MAEVSQIGIFSQVLCEETIDILKKIISLEESKSISFSINPELYQYIQSNRPKLVKNFHKTKLSGMNVDCIFSIGGDGTILRIARVKPDIPILSINKGRKGFMTEIEANEIESSLAQFFKGNYRLEEHTKIVAKIRDDIQASAINEILITSGDLLKPIDFKVLADNEVISGSSADGIIIATPVGSTGHSLSSGGSIIDPDLQGLIISWINPINLAIRPVILKFSRNLEIICSTRINPIKMVFDGQVSLEYTTPVKFSISLSQEKVKFYRLRHFTSRWRQHLHPEIRD